MRGFSITLLCLLFFNSDSVIAKLEKKSQKTNKSLHILKKCLQMGASASVPLYHACTYLKPALWPHSYFKNTNLVSIEKLSSVLPYSRVGLCSTIDSVLTTMNINAHSVKFTNNDFALLPQNPAEPFGNSIMILDSMHLSKLNETDQKKVLCSAFGHMKSNLMLKKVITGFATPVMTYCGFKAYDYITNTFLDYVSKKSQSYPKTHTMLKKIQYINNYIANSWVTHLFVNILLFYAITHRQEINASQSLQ